MNEHWAEFIHHRVEQEKDEEQVKIVLNVASYVPQVLSPYEWWQTFPIYFLF